jgi:DNA invertase Pin-like site-specific DNA recombinase
MNAKLVAYVRVSTEKQGASGLGLEGQQDAIDAYARQSGGTVIAKFLEVESGKRSDRPELARAIAHARRAKAVLVVAKLDRLARNVAFLSRLLEAGVEFVACDNPSANRLTIHILAAVAEAEAKAISERTKAALAAAKRRGIALGSARAGHWEGKEERRRQGAMKGTKVAAAARKTTASEAYSDLLPTIQEHRAAGASFATIAEKLNKEGCTTRQGKAFTPMTIHRIMVRASS